VSVRLAGGDIRKIKKLAQRLNVRDTDIIRFAIKTTLARLAPLHDQSVRGNSLVPVFLECGAELLRHFDLDAARLDDIINDGANDGQRVESDDIALLAMGDGLQRYAVMRLGKPGGDVAAADRFTSTLRQYLYEKYLLARTAPGDSKAIAGDRRNGGA
jgi:hypothetical protein